MLSTRTAGLFAGLILILALAGCAGSATPETAATPSQGMPLAPQTPLPTLAPEPTVEAPVSPLPTPGTENSPLPTPGVSDSPLPTPGPSVYQPIPGSECEAVRALVGETLGQKPDSSEAPFEDYLTAESGAGCAITLTGTGADFGSFVDASQELQAAFEEEGWESDMNYQADGPTGTAWAMRQGDQLALFSVGWTPAEDAKCPPDQPISTCDVKPEQQMFEIMVNVATK